jgi:trk system potassium uptake protein
VVSDSELRAYLAIIAVAIALVTVDLWRAAGMRLGQGLRFASFQVASILSTTGYYTADYTTWPALSQIVLFVLMFIGGCAGSTSGGVKVVRFVMVFKQAATEMRYQIWPRGVFAVQVNGRAVRKNVIYGVYAFVFTYFAIAILSTMVVASAGYDIVTSLTGTLATLGNIGPGFARVGPVANYGHFPEHIKWWLSLVMMTGRLEVYTVLLLLTPSFWKR